MEQIRQYADARQTDRCAFCGSSTTGTRDHCPSKIFLDEPYPENLPVVPACLSCNSGFSADETYLACLLSCTLSGSTNPERQRGSKVAKILRHSPALSAALEQASTIRDGRRIWASHEQRVGSVLLKLARGHALFELAEPRVDQPSFFGFRPLEELDPDERQAFERGPDLPTHAPFPELGSRAMGRLLVVVGPAGDDAVTFPMNTRDGWIVVQEGAYRYRASCWPRVAVSIVIDEYLGCHVVWSDD